MPVRGVAGAGGAGKVPLQSANRLNVREVFEIRRKPRVPGWSCHRHSILLLVLPGETSFCTSSELTPGYPLTLSDWNVSTPGVSRRAQPEPDAMPSTWKVLSK